MEKKCKKCDSIIENKTYLLECNLCRLCYNKKGKIESRKYYKEHKDRVLARTARYKVKNAEKIKKMAKIKILLIKKEVLSHYSKEDTPVCRNPFGIHEKPAMDIRYLSIDHINGSGSKHRVELNRRGWRFYVWLKNNNYPEGYQCLCLNCQFIKEHEKKGITRQFIEENNI